MKLRAYHHVNVDRPDDFAHPDLAEGHPLRDQVLYRIRNPLLG